MSLRVKICGITRPADAEAAAEAGADAVGFVFWSGSPRRVLASDALRIGSSLPPQVARVGVFVDEPMPALLQAAREARLSMAQLHGEEGPGFCDLLGLDCYRAFGVSPETDAPALAAEIARFGGRPFMLDTRGGVLPGGSGKRFDWSVAREVGRLLCGNGPARMILGGGLTPGNVGEAIVLLRPFGLLGVDVSTGVEASPGIKDPARVRAFIASVRNAP
ncbi:MAG TPA: phosphoribosylanthranilate isomerase [Candidatus Polarisedimenticolia bacterium]|jgi:phosphoribosylanthranilate isomerase